MWYNYEKEIWGEVGIHALLGSPLEPHSLNNFVQAELLELVILDSGPSFAKVGNWYPWK